MTTMETKKTIEVSNEVYEYLVGRGNTAENGIKYLIQTALCLWKHAVVFDPDISFFQSEQFSDEEIDKQIRG